MKYLHPDYNEEDLLIGDICNESKTFLNVVNSLSEDMKDHPTITMKAWLGTLEIDGKECQVQLVVTAEDFIDEN